VEDGLFRCVVPLHRHSAFIDSLFVNAIVNFSNTPLNYAPSGEVVVHNIPIDDRAIHMQAVLDCLQVLFSLSTVKVLIVGGVKNNFASILIACIRRIQRWSIVSTIAEFRANGTCRNLDAEQYIESFDPRAITFPAGRIPAYIQSYIDAKVRDCIYVRIYCMHTCN
jgi:hypothetical protein